MNCVSLSPLLSDFSQGSWVAILDLHQSFLGVASDIEIFENLPELWRYELLTLGLQFSMLTTTWYCINNHLVFYNLFPKMNITHDY